jgi:hypothetical protein
MAGVGVAQLLQTACGGGVNSGSSDSVKGGLSITPYLTYNWSVVTVN